MVEKKKTQWKPLTAKQKAMIKSAKWRELGISEEELKEMENNIFKKYLAEDLLKLKMDTRKYFFVGIVIGTLFAVIVSFFINSLFKMIESIEGLIPIEIYVIWFLVSGAILIVLLGVIYYWFVKD